MIVYIGYDPREQAAYDVAEKTAKQFGCTVLPIKEENLRLSGMLTRPVDRRGGMWDLNSSAPQSTDFALSRFAVPLLAHAGWALYVDCDVLFLEDPRAMLAIADRSKAVMVIKHRALALHEWKMNGARQTDYPRKLWSSVILWNLDHHANKRLNLTTLNQWPGRELHAFAWLADSEIGELPEEWNHLVGIKPYSQKAKLLHFTLGTPDMVGFENCEYADIWWSAKGAKGY